jgi:hypothetical protein
MEVLQLNLNIVEDAATAAQHRHTKLDWRERKRQVGAAAACAQACAACAARVVS